MEEKELMYLITDIYFTEPVSTTNVEKQASLFEEFITDNFDLEHCAGKTVFLKNNWFSKGVYDYVEVYFRVVDQEEDEYQINTYLALDITLHEIE